jgi:hypothetical protein
MLSKPRFPLRRVLPALAVICILFFSACADRIKTDLIAYEVMDEGLTNTNILIDNVTIGSFKELEDKLAGPVTAEKAKIWMAKATAARELSREIIRYIEGLKSALREEAGGGVLRKADKRSVMRLFEREKKGVELYQHLKTYRDDVLAIDPIIGEAFSQNIIVVTIKSFDSTANQEQNFTKTFFDDIPAIAAQAMLSKFENNVKSIELKTIDFCNNQVRSFDSRRFYNMNVAFAAINSSYVRGKEQLEITAGVGAFSKTAQPVITIDKRNLPLEADGASHFTFRAPDKPGKYSVTVKITYKDEEGKERTIMKTIKYAVAGDKE